MRICIYCGKKIPEEAKNVCPSCGKPLRFVDEDGYDGFYEDFNPPDYDPKDDNRWKIVFGLVAAFTTILVSAVLIITFVRLSKNSLPAEESDPLISLESSLPVSEASLEETKSPETTKGPTSTTAAPKTTTAVPKTQEDTAPAPTTEALNTTEALATTTAVPKTTEAPKTTTAAPKTTEAPKTTTAAPKTTEAPKTTTAAPETKGR